MQRLGRELPNAPINEMDIGKIELTRAIIEERALEFKERVNACLASYDDVSRPEALEHLKKLRNLYNVSQEIVGERLNELVSNLIN